MKNSIAIYGLVLTTFIFAVLPISAVLAEQEKDRLLVIPLMAQKGIDQEEAILLTDILSVEIHRSGRFTILNREDMKAILDEKEFELVMGCDDNICLLENVEKLAVNKLIAGNIGKLGEKYIITIRLINEDGENEVMERESCDCEISELDKTIEQISYKFLRHLDGDVLPEDSIVAESELGEVDRVVDIVKSDMGYQNDRRNLSEIRDEWSEWQDNMTIAYNEALRRDDDARLKIREKARGWKQIIEDFRQDNPYSAEDDRIRRHAKIRLKEYMRLAGRSDRLRRPDKPGRHPKPTLRPPKEKRRW